MYIYIYTYTFTYVYVYIYIYREREGLLSDLLLSFFSDLFCELPTNMLPDKAFLPIGGGCLTNCDRSLLLGSAIA